MQLIIENSSNSFHNNSFYLKWIKNLQTSDIYDTLDKAFPFTSSPLTFKVTEGGSYTKNVYHGDFLFMTTIEAEFTFSIYPLPGNNKILIKDTSNHLLESFYFSTYHIHFLVFTLATYINDLYGKALQTKVDGILNATQDFGLFPTTRTPTDYGLTQLFSQFLNIDRLGITNAEFISKIKAIQDAFYYCGTVGAQLKIAESYAPADFDIVTYIDLEEFQTSTSGTVQRVDVGNVEWMPGRIKMNNRNYYLSYGSMSIGVSTENFLYVDGEVDVNNYLVVKASSTEPLGDEYTISEEFVDYNIQIDTSGELTGIVNGKYISVANAVNELVSVTSDGVVDVLGGQLITNTTFVNLFTDYDEDDIGTVTVQYKTFMHPIILAKVTAGVSGVSKVEDPVPSRGAIYRTTSLEESDYEIYIGDDTFTDDELTELQQLLRAAEVASGRGHIYVKDDTQEPTDYEYHKWHYKFIGYTTGTLTL